MRSLHRLVDFLLVLSITDVGWTAQAAADEQYFKSPSGNINCAYFSKSRGIGANVSCYIDNFVPTLKKSVRQSKEEIEALGRCAPAGMSAFKIEADSKTADVWCPTDTVKTEKSAVLQYGENWKAEGFVCFSRTSGIECKNSLGHGFSLSRSRQKVF